MPHKHAKTLGELKESGYRTRPVKDEIRHNLLRRLEEGGALFPGIVGYEDSVIPQLVAALLARQNFILLGLRGQAKSRLLRQIASFLDDEIPIVAGSEINDDPLNPISRYARLLIEEHGDDSPIEWVPRAARYVEKLATPDVTIADILGDVDPIRAARGGHVLADELTIHFGLMPRANRGIFAINELPDLAGKIQVGLFNAMQEGDVQIKGYPVRLPLDLLLVFTANPEDYTARGKIITPLKDRIGAEISTHYPERVDLGIDITRQEAWLERDGPQIEVPDFVAETIERITFLARDDKRIDQRSGVSQRMPISVLDNAVSSAERRALLCSEPIVVPRLCDIYAALPAITGKLELEYEGELVGVAKIARELVSRAAAETFEARSDDEEGEHIEEIVAYFEKGGVLQLTDTSAAEACVKGFSTITGLFALVEQLGVSIDDAPGHAAAGCELVLEALVARRRISRSEVGQYRRASGRRRPPGGLGPASPTLEV